MPTPVSTARQCLTPEAARVLDDGVVVAHRRSHAQTTSLHVISSFLSLPSSILREACSRTRNSSYSSRLQFKALELCFNVALDRLPSSKNNNNNIDEPPISNSLMAAIRRSQANQRRHPETFHLHLLQQQQQQQNQSSISCVKVEIQQFILSILDDPVVSRVFGDAGFRSTDIKFSILRPSPQSLIRYTSSSYPPLFLCNLAGSGGDFEPGRRSFSFPFSGGSEISNGDENCRRIGDILGRKKNRNPLLVGICAIDTIRSFKEFVESGKNGVLPIEISGLDFICIENEIQKFVRETKNKEVLGMKFEELGRLVESCSGPGIVISYGDLKAFIEDGCSDAISYLISELTKLVQIHIQSGKLWLMGTTPSYETYLRFITKFPSIEKDWDLQLLPITSSRHSSMGGGYFAPPQSLMESFVPLGGFYSTPSNSKSLLGSTYQSLTRCHLCNEKYKQEVSVILTGDSTVPVTDQYRANLPSWLQSTEINTNNGSNVTKAKDDETVLNTKVAGLQKKWNDICGRLHQSFRGPIDASRVGHQVFPCVVGFPVVAERKDHRFDNRQISDLNASPNENGSKSLAVSLSLELQKASEEGPNLSNSGDSKTRNGNSPQKLHTRYSMGEQSRPCTISTTTIPDEHASPSSGVSVTTDLGLGTLYSSIGRESKAPTYESHRENLEDSSGCFSAEVGLANETIPNHPIRSSSSSGLDSDGQFYLRDFKILWKTLKQKVGRQDEALYAVSRTIACCKTGKERYRGASLKGDIWFSFLGPDRVAKKKLAISLAEVIYGSRHSLIYADLASPERVNQPKTIFDFEEINGYDVNFRGKTIIDYIAAEIRKRPLSVILLENVDKADTLTQSCLSQAIKTGKFTDSYGREVGINNTTFVITSQRIRGNGNFGSTIGPTKFSEENILESKRWEMKLLTKYDPECTITRAKPSVFISSRKSASSLAILNKRKLIGTGNPSKRVQKTSNKFLDLNIPIEDSKATDEVDDTIETTSVSETSTECMNSFFQLVDERVVFEPFDFDCLAEEVLKKIRRNIEESIVGFECQLEIDSQAMEQILAASWLSDNDKAIEYWVEQVLISSIVEARKRYGIEEGSILKLVTCEGLQMKEEAPGLCLPARIILP